MFALMKEDIALGWSTAVTGCSNYWRGSDNVLKSLKFAPLILYLLDIILYGSFRTCWE